MKDIEFTAEDLDFLREASVRDSADGGKQSLEYQLKLSRQQCEHLGRQLHEAYRREAVYQFWATAGTVALVLTAAALIGVCQCL